VTLPINITQRSNHVSDMSTAKLDIGVGAHGKLFGGDKAK
jgi:hypothetical protein